MDLRRVSIGAKTADAKKIKEVEVRPVHIVFFLLFLMIIVYLIVLGLTKSGLIEEELTFVCTTGEETIIEFGVMEYCGQHYSEIKNWVSIEEFEKIEGRIYGTE